MIVTALLSLVAGVLTVLAPCVLPFLPVIVGESLGHSSTILVDVFGKRKC